MNGQPEILDSEAALAPFLADWDALAVLASRPYCAPAWMLAWWRWAAPPNARLRVVVVRDGVEVIGVAPFFAQPQRAGTWIWRLLCSGTSARIGPLAAPARTQEVARALVSALRSIERQPDIVRFEGTESGSPWPQALADAWPSRIRPRVRCDLELAAPTVQLDGLDFAAWLASRSRSFRRELLRLRRRWADLGATIEPTPAWRLDDDLEQLERLHLARWASRGGSTNIDPGRRAMLSEAGRALLAHERFRLWTIRVAGDVAAAELFVAAGTELAAWGGGFDSRWQNLGPSIVTIASAVEDAASRGERRVDLGEGFEDFKFRLGEDVQRVAWTSVFPRTRRYPLVRALVLPKELRYEARRRLSPRRKRQIKKLLARVHV